MALGDLTQTERLGLRGKEIVHLVEWTLSGDTLYLSDRALRASDGTAYDPYILAIEGLGEVVDFNTLVRIRLKNTAWTSYAYLSSLNKDQAFQRSAIAIYESRLVDTDEEVPASPTLLWKGNVQQVSDINRESFVLICNTRLFNAKDKLGLDTINATDFPYADHDDVGKHRNILYGDLEHVPCRSVKAGSIDILAADLTKTATSVVVSGVALISWESSGTIQINHEKMTYSAYNTGTRTFTITQRGAGGTTATEHKIGDGVVQVLTSYIYEIAKHPIKSISAVFVENVRQTANYYAYTGQSGDEKAGYEGTAVIDFIVPPIVFREIATEIISEHGHATDTIDEHGHDSDVSAEHGHSTATGSHGHSLSSPPSSNYRKLVVSTGGTGSDLNNIMDGNENSYCLLNGAQYVTGTIESGDFGDIRKVEVYALVENISANGTTLSVQFGGTLVGSPASGSPKGWFRYTLTTTNEAYWNGQIQCNSQTGAQWRIYEAYADIYYDSNLSVDAGPASGVSASRSGDTGVATSLTGATTSSTYVSVDTVLGGLSVADMIIGGEVTIHCQGYQDDGSGTYTGTPNALIQRPDHVFKHILIALMGFSSGDIGSSFAASGTEYSSLTYNLAFIMHDCIQDATNLRELAKQSRSIFYEWEGKFELKFLPDAVLSTDASLELDELDFLSEPTYEYSPLHDIKNLVRCYYRRDFRGARSTGKGGYILTKINHDAFARGYMDMLEGSSGAGDLHGELLLNSVRTSAMAQDVLDYWLDRWDSPKLTMNAELEWRAIQLGPGEYFTWTDSIFGYRLFHMTDFKPDRANGRISITGEEVVVNILLTMNDSAHAQTAESPDLFMGSTLVMVDCGHGLSSDSVLLTQLHILGIIDSSHIHSAETISFDYLETEAGEPFITEGGETIIKD